MRQMWWRLMCRMHPWMLLWCHMSVHVAIFFIVALGTLLITILSPWLDAKRLVELVFLTVQTLSIGSVKRTWKHVTVNNTCTDYGTLDPVLMVTLIVFLKRLKSTPLSSFLEPAFSRFDASAKSVLLAERTQKDAAAAFSPYGTILTFSLHGQEYHKIHWLVLRFHTFRAPTATFHCIFRNNMLFFILFLHFSYSIQKPFVFRFRGRWEGFFLLTTRLVLHGTSTTLSLNKH